MTGFLEMEVTKGMRDRGERFLFVHGQQDDACDDQKAEYHGYDKW